MREVERLICGTGISDGFEGFQVKVEDEVKVFGGVECLGRG